MPCSCPVDALWMFIRCLSRKKHPQGIWRASAEHLGMTCRYLVDAQEILFQSIQRIAQPPPLACKLYHEHNWDDWEEVQKALRCPSRGHASQFFTYRTKCDWDIRGKLLLFYSRVQNITTFNYPWSILATGYTYIRGVNDVGATTFINNLLSLVCLTSGWQQLSFQNNHWKTRQCEQIHCQRA